MIDVSLLEKFVTYLAYKPFLENKIILSIDRGKVVKIGILGKIVGGRWDRGS